MLKASEILRELTTNRVEFVVVGGLAMVSHGAAYVTDDLDICYGRSEENIGRLAAALTPFRPYLRGAPAGLPFHFDAPTIAAGLNFTLSTDAGPVDVLGEIAGVGRYPEVLVQSELREVYGLPIRILSLDALIASKRASDRIKDRLHLLELAELKKLREAKPEP